nr:4307_t:CDS:2 [Entrophospora candida]
MSNERINPNILITGTPGTGKSTLSELLAKSTNYKYINVGELAKEKNLYDGYNETFDTNILDDDKVVDELEEIIEEDGGNIIDFHSCELFPERWFDLIIVLRADITILYDRLEKRKYTGQKITENVDCEIFQIVLEEAKESYSEEIVVELQSNNTDDIENNLSRIEEWIKNWKILNNNN